MRSLAKELKTSTSTTGESLAIRPNKTNVGNGLVVSVKPAEPAKQTKPAKRAEPAKPATAVKASRPLPEPVVVKRSAKLVKDEVEAIIRGANPTDWFSGDEFALPDHLDRGRFKNACSTLARAGILERATRWTTPTNCIYIFRLR